MKKVIDAKCNKEEVRTHFNRFIYISLLFFILIINSNNVSAWWNTSFSYQRPINMTENSGINIFNYTINFTLDTQTIIAAGKMNSNCSDIRLLENDTFVKDFSVEKCNTTATEFVYKTNISASAFEQDYIYYGSSSAGTGVFTNTSVENATWIRREHFFVNDSYWNIIGSCDAGTSINTNSNQGDITMAFSGNGGDCRAYHDWGSTIVYGYVQNVTWTITGGSQPCGKLEGFRTAEAALGSAGCGTGTSELISASFDSSGSGSGDVWINSRNATNNSASADIEKQTTNNVNMTTIVQYSQSRTNASGYDAGVLYGSIFYVPSITPSGGNYRYEYLISGAASSGRSTNILVWNYNMKFYTYPEPSVTIGTEALANCNGQDHPSFVCVNLNDGVADGTNMQTTEAAVEHYITLNWTTERCIMNLTAYKYYQTYISHAPINFSYWNSTSLKWIKFSVAYMETIGGSYNSFTINNTWLKTTALRIQYDGVTTSTQQQLYEKENDCVAVLCGTLEGGRAWNGIFNGCDGGKSCQKFLFCEDGVQVLYKAAREDFVEHDPTFKLDKLAYEEVEK